MGRMEMMLRSQEKKMGKHLKRTPMTQAEINAQKQNSPKKQIIWTNISSPKKNNQKEFPKKQIIWNKTVSN